MGPNRSDVSSTMVLKTRALARSASEIPLLLAAVFRTQPRSATASGLWRNCASMTTGVEPAVDTVLPPNVRPSSRPSASMSSWRSCMRVGAVSPPVLPVTGLRRGVPCELVQRHVEEGGERGSRRGSAARCAVELASSSAAPQGTRPPAHS